MFSPLTISILAIIFAALSLSIASKFENNRTVNLFGYLAALILYGVFLDFGIQVINNSGTNNTFAKK